MPQFESWPTATYQTARLSHSAAQYIRVETVWTDCGRID